MAEKLITRERASEGLFGEESLIFTKRPDKLLRAEIVSTLMQLFPREIDTTNNAVLAPLLRNTRLSYEAMRKVKQFPY